MLDWAARFPLLSIALLAALFFLPGLGNVHLFDWDEINFAEAAREMLVTDNWLQVQINYQPFYQKPPLFLWFQALAMQLCGVGEYGARLPNAVCGILTLMVLYKIGKNLRDARFGWLWAGSYFGAMLPFLYFKSGIIDPWFNLFIFLGLYGFIQFYWKKEGRDEGRLRYSSWRYLLLGGWLLGLGILTKGPVAYLLVALTLGCYWVYRRFQLYVSIPQFLLYSLAAAAAPLIWFGLDILKNDATFVQEFIRYQWRLFSTPDAGHKGFPGYHFVVLLIGCFPASIPALRSLIRGKKMTMEDGRLDDFRRWMTYLFWVVLILFTIVQSKIVHYSSLCYFPLSFLAALSWQEWWEKQKSPEKWVTGVYWFIGGLFVLATAALPWLGRQIDFLKPLFAKDPFALGNLEADVYWTGWEMLPGLILIFVLWLTMHWWRRLQFRPAITMLFVGMAVFVSTTLYFDIRRIEHYSQRAAVEFFASLRGEDVYVLTTGYKSYAHLFYSRKPPVINPESHQYDWLLYGDIDKPLYIATKVHRTNELVEVPNLVELSRKNGFVFYRRDPG